MFTGRYKLRVDNSNFDPNILGNIISLGLIF